MITPEQKRARKVLIKYARRKRTITYSELCQQAKLSYDLSNEYGRVSVGNFLGDLSVHEFLMKRPIISSIVVSQSTSKPGGGIFTLGENLGWNIPKSETARTEWWIKRLNSTHEFWSEYDGAELNDDEDSVDRSDDYPY